MIIINWPPKKLYESGLEDAFKFYQLNKTDIPKEVNEIENFFEEF